MSWYEDRPGSRLDDLNQLRIGGSMTLVELVNQENPVINWLEQ